MKDRVNPDPFSLRFACHLCPPFEGLFCTPISQTINCATQNLPRLSLLISKVYSPSQQLWGVQTASLGPRWHLMQRNWQGLVILRLSRWT